MTMELKDWLTFTECDLDGSNSLSMVSLMATFTWLVAWGMALLTKRSPGRARLVPVERRVRVVCYKSELLLRSAMIECIR